MAEARGTAKFNEKINKFLTDVGEDTLLFSKDSTPVLKVVNEYIEKWRKELENAPTKKRGHIGSGNLYSTLGEGWKIEIQGKTGRIILELPKYYSATDTGRKPSEKKQDFAVYKAMIWQSSSLAGWIANKGIKVPTEYTIKRKLKDGTEKTKTYKYISNEFGTAKEKGNKALGFLFSRKINQKGFKGTGWFSKHIKDFEKDMINAVQEQFGKDVIFNLNIITR